MKYFNIKQPFMIKIRFILIVLDTPIYSTIFDTNSLTIFKGNNFYFYQNFPETFGTTNI